MVRLVMGIGLFAFGVYSTQKEKRQLRNAVYLGAGLVYLIIGLFSSLEFFISPLTLVGDSVWEVSATAELAGTLYLLLCCLVNIMGLFLIVNGFVLISKERVCLAHLLPIIFGLLCFCLPAFLLNGYIRNLYKGSYLVNLIAIGVKGLVRGVVLYVPFITACYAFYSLYYIRCVNTAKADYIVIHGARIKHDSPSPLLQKRIEKAIELFKSQKEHSYIIASGGQGNDEEFSEAYVIKKYLVDHGITPDKILMEDKSTTTYENLLFSKQMIEHMGPDKDYYCVFVTSNYHVLRTAIWAKRAGINGDSIGCKTARYYMPAAAIRESIAFIFQYKKLAFGFVSWMVLSGILGQIIFDLFGAGIW